MSAYMRAYDRLSNAAAVATLWLCIAAPSALAAPITYTFSGPVSGSLAGTPFTGAQVTITASGDTSNIPDPADCVVGVCNSLASVTFTIGGIGSGNITDGLYIFDNQSTVGLTRTAGGKNDWLESVNAQFQTYGLATSIGPLSVTPGPVSPTGSVATTAGVLTLTSSPNSFQALTLGGAAPPTLAKFFGAVSIPLNGSLSLSFTINNPNASTALAGVGFTDTLPAGLAVSTPNGLSGSCGGGTITATAGSGSISLAGATLVASGSCNFSVNVTGTTAGTKNNTTGAVTSVEGGNGNTASASFTVIGAVAPPTIAKSFGAASIAPNGSTSLNFTINNPNASTTLTGVGFTDTLPTGLVVSTPNGLIGSCGGGTIAATAGSGSISLIGATLAASGSCNFSVSVTATALGTMNNTTGAVTSVQGGTGGTASASVAVGAAPPPPATIPTLQQWALWLLGLLILFVTAGVTLRPRKKD
jgi:IPTL-CTERM motif